MPTALRIWLTDSPGVPFGAYIATQSSPTMPGTVSLYRIERNGVLIDAPMLAHYEIILMIHPDQSEQVPAMLERYKGTSRSRSMPVSAPS